MEKIAESGCRIIDAWTHPALTSMYEKLPEVAYLLKRSGTRAHTKKSIGPDEMIAVMDEAGIEKVLLRAWSRPGQWVCTNEQVLFGTNFPHMDLKRCASGAAELDLPVSTLKRFFFDNARKVFKI